MGESVTSPEAFAIFERLLGLEPPEHERQLDALKRARPDLHAQVLALVESDRQADACGYLEGRAQLTAARPEAGLLAPGQVLGVYRIERQLGAGGMGEVWLGTRADGRYQGHVAIKALHPLLARAAIGERFAREGVILGRLSHPNIARLLDAGVSAEGLPYLVLEYIEGERIDRWCEQRHLDVARRLRLFLQVCEAVSHAHARLVVHRDLKPSNILVTGDGTAKLLDFGIAKMLETETGQGHATELTRLAGRALTPEYAAPEQVRGEPVTTATDVYSLGVILFALLAGRRPYGADTATQAQLEHDVTDTEPQRLSMAAPLERRRTLRGDLDNILAKALKKMPSERYASVQALADDLQRFLEFRPVSARPDALGYRARKFLRRNRLFVAAGTAVGLAVVAGLAATIWQARLATAEAQRARAEADRLARVQAFLYTALDRGNPLNPNNPALTMKELWEMTLAGVETDFADDPDLQARLVGDFANMTIVRGDWARAEQLIQRELELLTRAHGADHPRLARPLGHYAFVNSFRGRMHEALRHSERALEILRAHGDTSSPEYYEVLGDWSSHMVWLGRGDEASAAAEEVLAQLRAWPEPLLEPLLFQLARVGRIRLQQGRLDEAEAAFKEGMAVAIQEGGPNTTYRIPMLLGFAHVARARGDTAAELEHAERCLAIVRKDFKGDYFYPGQALLAAGMARTRSGRAADGEPLIREAIAMQERLGDDTIAASYRALADNLAARKLFDERRDVIRQGREACNRLAGDIGGHCQLLRAAGDDLPQ